MCQALPKASEVVVVVISEKCDKNCDLGRKIVTDCNLFINLLEAWSWIFNSLLSLQDLGF